jgi:glucokinase
MVGLAGSGSVVGLDVGGTLLKAVAVGPEGGVTARVRQPTAAGDGAGALMERVVALLVGMRDELLARGEVLRAVGLAVPGVIDEEAGVVRFAANLGWRDVEVTSFVARRLGVPVYLGHDVRSGALAEGVLGAARGVDDFLFLPIGTGIAAALVLGGQVRAGPRGSAGELGHLVVEPGGPPCRCGARGCLETLASASALARRYQEQVPGSTLEAPAVAVLAAQRDTVALAVWSSAVGSLGQVLAGVQSLVDLDLVVVGGGLANAERLLADLEGAIAARLPWQVAPRLTTAALGDEAGSLGAALLARAGGGAVRLGSAAALS